MGQTLSRPRWSCVKTSLAGLHSNSPAPEQKTRCGRWEAKPGLRRRVRTSCSPCNPGVPIPGRGGERSVVCDAFPRRPCQYASQRGRASKDSGTTAPGHQQTASAEAATGCGCRVWTNTTGTLYERVRKNSTHGSRSSRQNRLVKPQR